MQLSKFGATISHQKSARACAILAVAGFAAWLGACGENAFTTGPNGQAPEDVRPRVEILQPAEGTIFAVGDSIAVRVNATDNRALQTVELTGVAVRTNSVGATQTVERFASRTITVGGGERAVRDTTFTVLLTANADTSSDRDVLLIATAVDASGNRRADTVRVSVTRPRIVIVAPVEGAVVPAGTPLAVRLLAVDPIDGVASVRVTATGAVEGVFNVPAPSSGDSVTVAIPVPATARGSITLVAEVTTRSGFVRRTDATTVQIVDATPPTVDILVPATAVRVAVADSIFTRVRVADVQGLASLQISGFALRGSATLGTQTRVERFASKTVAFAPTGPPVTDTTISRFLLATPDTLGEATVFVVAVATDRAGNISQDTTVVSIGGPRVQIVSPDDQASVFAGTQVPVRITARDPVNRISSLVLRVSGAITQTLQVMLPLQAAVDTTIRITLPRTVAGDSLRIVAIAVSANGDSAISRRVALRVLPAAPDLVAPQVSFVTDLRTRTDVSDTLTVSVTATDASDVATVGATVVAVFRSGGRIDTLAVRAQSVAGTTGTFRFAISQFDLDALRSRLAAQDTFTLGLEITAFAVDAANNCAAAVSAGVPQSLPCRPGPNGSTVTTIAGGRLETTLTRGTLIRLPFVGDRLADLVSDGSRVFASNFSRNRVEAISVDSNQLVGSIRVGSEPWGVALSPNNNLLYVANSGGTNISVVDPTALTEVQRIQTANIRLFGVPYQLRDVVIPIDSVRSDTLRNQLVPSAVNVSDFSDRPQFIGQTAGGQVLYSTKPTNNAPNGTLRRLRGTGGDSEFFVEYARGVAVGAASEAVIVNARDIAFIPTGRPVAAGKNRGPEITVSPKGCTDGDSAAIGFVNEVLQQLVARQCDTRIELGINLAALGLSDTTYIAVSGDHSTIAFGEGDRPASERPRIILFQEQAGGLLVQSGDVEDLTNNTSEIIIGLGLNQNGSLGIARGEQAYLFDPALRLQGVISTGSPTGGVALHPLQGAGGPPFAFVSGIDDAGSPYLDVVQVSNFFFVRRIFLREAITGSVIAVLPNSPTPDGPVLKVYGITRTGVVAVDIFNSDFVPR